MKRTFTVGDVVAFRADFLRSVGWYTDVPKNGRVIEVLDAGKPFERYKVEWCDPGLWGTTAVLARNLLLYSERGKEPN